MRCSIHCKTWPQPTSMGLSSIQLQTQHVDWVNCIDGKGDRNWDGSNLGTSRARAITAGGTLCEWVHLILLMEQPQILEAYLSVSPYWKAGFLWLCIVHRASGTLVCKQLVQNWWHICVVTFDSLADSDWQSLICHIPASWGSRF